MRIAIISTMAGVPWGGSEELWYRVAELAKKQGHEVTVYVFKWDNNPIKINELLNKGIKVVFRRRFNFNSYSGKVIGKVIERSIALPELRSVFKFKPDLLIINQGSFFDMEVPLYHRFLQSTDIPYVNIVHGNTEDDLLSVASITKMRAIYLKSSKVFFVSTRNKEVAERQLCMQILNSDIIINPIGFSNKTLVPFPQTKKINFAIVGRIDAKRKGHAVLLDILRKKEWSSREWHLNIYGTGPDEAFLGLLNEFYELNNRVTLHGHVSNLRDTIWEKNHVLLMPSLNEGCPISLVEAMVCGRPAVVSDVGGNAELIQEDYNGFVADAATPNSFGKAMERMWARKDKLESLGLNAHHTAMQKLTNDPVENALEKFLSVLSNHQESKV